MKSVESGGNQFLAGDGEAVNLRSQTKLSRILGLGIMHPRFGWRVISEIK